MEAKEQIKEINQHISDALEQWSCIMVTSDANLSSYEFEYSDRDLLNALHIFTHVASNISIKNGHLNEKNICEKMDKYVAILDECFGFNSIELTNKVLNNGNKS